LIKTDHYESVAILSATLEDNQIESTLKRIEETITSNGGEISDLEKLGRKRLAYPIQKSKSGFYIIYRFIAPKDLIKKIERFYRLDETIIRYITIKLDNKDLEYIKRMKAKKEAEAEVVKEVAEKVILEDDSDKDDKVNNLNTKISTED